MALIEVNIHHHHNAASVTNHFGSPELPPDNNQGGDKSKSGLKVGIVDIFVGATFSTLQSYWNTPMLAWTISWLHSLGFGSLPAPVIEGLAVFLIMLLVCALTPVVRWIFKRLYS